MCISIQSAREGADVFCLKFLPLGSVGPVFFLFLSPKNELTEKKKQRRKLQKPFPTAQRDGRNAGTAGGRGQSQRGCRGQGRAPHPSAVTLRLTSGWRLFVPSPPRCPRTPSALPGPSISALKEGSLLKVCPSWLWSGSHQGHCSQQPPCSCFSTSLLQWDNGFPPLQTN